MVKNDLNLVHLLPNCEIWTQASFTSC